MFLLSSHFSTASPQIAIILLCQHAHIFRRSPSLSVTPSPVALLFPTTDMLLWLASTKLVEIISIGTRVSSETSLVGSATSLPSPPPLSLVTTPLPPCRPLTSPQTVMSTDETLAALNGPQLLMGLAHLVFSTVNLVIQSRISSSLYHPNLAPKYPSLPQTYAGSSMLQSSLNFLSSNSNLERLCFLLLAFKANSTEDISPMTSLRKELPSPIFHHLEESLANVYQCLTSAFKSNTTPSDVRNFKFSGFFQNPVTSTQWHKSDDLNPYAIYLFIFTRCIALRNALGLMARVSASWLEWICVQRPHYRFVKSCDSLSSVEVRCIRPISLSSRGYWLLVLQPRNLSSFRERVLLSSLQKIIAQVSMTLVLVLRVKNDHVMVVGLKKVDAKSVSLQNSTFRCPVDGDLFVAFSVVGWVLVKASGKVSMVSNSV